MSITDKELLTFCNLANLEMEYANLKIIESSEDNDSDKTIERNHTIYTIFL